MVKKYWLWSALISICCSTSWALESKSQMSIQNVKKQKTFEENLAITNPELKAQAGSLSRYSVKATLSYSGAGVSTPLGKEQPNPDQSPGDYRTRMGGSLSARYRMSSDETLSFGTGISAFTPLQEMQDFEMQDPFVGVDQTAKLGELQNRISASVSGTTTKSYAEKGQVASLSLTESIKYKVGLSPWTWGFSTGVSFFFFDREYQRGDGKMSNYHLNVLPSLEYQINSWMNVNSSLYQAYSNLRREQDWKLWDKKTLSGRLGMGFSVTREIYLQPYLNFYPEQFTWETTTLSMNSVFSVF